jgi:hypothetical protein
VIVKIVGGEAFCFRMQIRMRNVESLTQAQMQEFLKGSRAVEFGGQNRANTVRRASWKWPLTGVVVFPRSSHPYRDVPQPGNQISRRKVVADDVAALPCRPD